MTEQQTLLNQLNKLPPAVARILCSKTDQQLAKASGLCRHTIMRISNQKEWHQVAAVSAFLEACGIEVNVTIPALRKAYRIMESKRGLSGVSHLRKTKKTSGVERIRQIRSIRRMEKALI